jgi:hypothetical protein
VSDSAAHDTGTDDGDVHREILSGSRLWALGSRYDQSPEPRA